MTLHTAKGLEFPVVFLTGMEDGVFPHMRALGETKELEEERRLAYVGITRARERLYLTRAIARAAWGQPAYNPPSRFLDEMPSEHVDWSGRSTGSRSNRSTPTRLAAPVLRPRLPGPGRPGPPRRFTPRAVDVRGASKLDQADPDACRWATGSATTASGWGTVVALRGAAEKAQAEVDFGSLGTKWLVLRFAPLVKL